MQEHSAVVIGATGLIGHHLLIRLLEAPQYRKVTALVRRPFHMKHPKLHVLVTDFRNREQVKEGMQDGDTLFCCIGTTQKNVHGDKAAYRHADLEIPLMAAELAKEMNYRSFLLVSAVGADSRSRNFYTRLKGETEDAIRAINLPALHIFRPSLLLGKRKELRPGERIAQAIMPFLSPLLPERIRPIEATRVANAMLSLSLTETGGTHIHQYRGIMNAFNKRP